MIYDVFIMYYQLLLNCMFFVLILLQCMPLCTHVICEVHRKPPLLLLLLGYLWLQTCTL